MGNYKTVVIDFPWPLKLGGSVPKKMQGTALSSDLPYESNNLEDIRNFPIEDYAAEDCLLFLWATCGKAKNGEPIIRLAIDILEDWGFTYHTILTWHKENPFSFWSPIRWATEHVVFGYRGEFPKIYAKMPSIFKAHNVKHSEKPARFYQLLRSWTSAPRIDLFARRAHPGFDGWGNEYVHDGPLAPFLEQSTITEE